MVNPLDEKIVVGQELPITNSVKQTNGDVLGAPMNGREASGAQVNGVATSI